MGPVAQLWQYPTPRRLAQCGRGQEDGGVWKGLPALHTLSDYTDGRGHGGYEAGSYQGHEEAIPQLPWTASS